MIKELGSVITQAWKNRDKVFEGIVNEVKASLGTLPQDEQDVIAERRYICAECPFNSSNAVANPLIKYKIDRIDEHCIFCLCNIQLKTASLESNCGIETHNQNNPNNQLPLKWEAYKKPKENG